MNDDSAKTSFDALKETLRALRRTSGNMILTELRTAETLLDLAGRSRSALAASIAVKSAQSTLATIDRHLQRRDLAPELRREVTRMRNELRVRLKAVER